MKNQPPCTHIHEKFRHIAHLSDKERLKFIDTPHWIGYTTANKAIDIMQGLMNKVRQHCMPNLLIIGESNTGKTTILDRFSRKFGNSYIKDDLDLVVPVVHIQAPPSANEKDLHIAILTTFVLQWDPDDTVISLRYRAINALRQCHVKLVIIDEVQYWLNGTKTEQQHLMNCIRFLSNELRLPFVLSGDPEAEELITLHHQYAGRFDVLSIPTWQNDDEFKHVVGNFERILPLKEPSNLTEPEKLNLIYSVSEGKIGGVRRLLSECATNAIKQGKENITVEMITEKAVSSLFVTLGLPCLQT